MKSLIKGAIKYKMLIIFTVIVLMIAGVYNYYFTPKQEVPNLKTSIALILTVYPGAAPEDVEQLVTSKIEDKVTEIPGFEYSKSISKNSYSTVVVRLKNGSDIDKAWDELYRKMDEAQADIPEECRPIEIKTNLADTAGIIISMSSDKYSYEELGLYAEEFKKELGKIDGIQRFDITGEQKKEVSIKIDTKKLNQYSLSLSDVTQLIKAQSIEIPLGHIENDMAKIGVRTNRIFNNLEDIKNMIIYISKEDRGIVRLRDIAYVGFDYQDSNYKIKTNGKQAVLLTGYFNEEENIVLIGNEVTDTINRLKQRLPKDIIFTSVLYQPEDVRASVNDFIINLILGVLFVIIVVFIGMGFRNAIIVSTAIPLSILITFSAMRLLGINIHMMSITALIVALGMLVDNAIVVSDAIQVRIDEGESKKDACANGVREVALPILTSTLTTVGALIPLMALPTMAGDYIETLPKIVIVALSASYFIALFVTPTLAYMFFKPNKKVKKANRVRDKFGDMLAWCFDNRKKTGLITLAVVVITCVIGFNLGLQFFPKADKSLVYIDITAEKAGDIDATERLSDQVESILDRYEEVDNYTVAIGNGLPKFYNTLDIYTESKDIAQFKVDLDLTKNKKYKKVTNFVDALQRDIDNNVIGGIVTVKELEIGEPIGAPVLIRLTGDDYEELGKLAKVIEKVLEDIDGTINIRDDYTSRDFEYRVDIDTKKSASLGMTSYDIQKEINIALMGSKAAIYRKSGKEFDIVVSSNIKSKEDLENIAIKSSFTNSKSIIKNIGQVSQSSILPSIGKYDRDLNVIIYSDVRPGYSPITIENALKSKIKDMDLKGNEIVFDGEFAKILENFGNVGASAVFAILVILCILLVQFNSITQPLVILLTIPLSAVGSIFGLFIFRQPLSFTAIFGIASLFGIVVNNAIVLIDYVNMERKNGVDITDACKVAVTKRFRPIMLSTITTVIGLIPLAVSGNDLFKPMSISLMFGLLVSTLLTLVIIPLVYDMIENKFHPKS